MNSKIDKFFNMISKKMKKKGNRLNYLRKRRLNKGIMKCLKMRKYLSQSKQISLKIVLHIYENRMRNNRQIRARRLWWSIGGIFTRNQGASSRGLWSAWVNSWSYMSSQKERMFTVSAAELLSLGKLGNHPTNQGKNVVTRKPR